MQNNTTEQASAPLNLGENVLASLTVDLDEQLHYAQGQLLLTNRRLLWCASGAQEWQSFALADVQAMRHFDHAGVGTLELLGTEKRLARWRFTLAANVQALRLSKRFEQQMETRRTGVAVEDDGTRCPSCRNPLPDDSDECAICTRELNTPPSSWVLLRLWRFAKPYQGKLLLGDYAKTGSMGGWAGELSKWIGSFGGGRADGGPVSAGRPYLVGERGPEIVVPRRSGTVLPNGVGMGGSNRTVNVTINMAAGGNGSQSTALQAGEAIGRQVRLALARNG